MVYAFPNTEGAIVEFKERYDNYIGGKWTPPALGEYFDNITPITGKVFTQVARGTAEDIEAAIDAAEAAKDAWGKTSVTERSNILNKIANRIEENIEKLAIVETWENGKAVRETLNADIPLAVDHFRYFAGAIRAQEGRLSQIDDDTVAYHFQEPIGVVGQIIPWNFPILMAVWKLAPALAAGNCVVLKPAEQTPTSILYLMELIEDLLPPGVVNIVNGFGVEAGKPLATNPRIGKVAFTGETTTGRLIMQYASQNLIPVTLELGGKSPNIFLEDIMEEDDAFLDETCYNLEQCIDMCLKYLLEMNGENLFDTNDVRVLINKLKMIDAKIPYEDRLRSMSNILNDWDIQLTCTGAVEPTLDDVIKVKKIAENLIEYCDKIVKVG